MEKNKKRNKMEDKNVGGKEEEEKEKEGICKKEEG